MVYPTAAIFRPERSRNFATCLTVQSAHESGSCWAVLTRCVLELSFTRYLVYPTAAIFRPERSRNFATCLTVQSAHESGSCWAVLTRCVLELSFTRYGTSG